MEEKVKNAIEKYQCPGCVVGGDISCFKEHISGIGCGSHCAGTNIYPIVGRIFLGMPVGFNRLGKCDDLKLSIFNSIGNCWEYDKFNVPVWKYLSEDNHTFVRGFMPRRNEPFLHIFLENCMNKINCLEITRDDINEMD